MRKINFNTNILFFQHVFVVVLIFLIFNENVLLCVTILIGEILGVEMDRLLLLFVIKH